MSTKKDGATICRDPVMIARAVITRSMPRLYCPTCERHDPSPVVQDDHGVWRHNPCPAVSVLRGKDVPAEYPVRDTRSYPTREEYVDALQGLLTIAEGGR